MPNYKYSFTDKDIILSQAEHEFCQEAHKNGQPISSLRDGSLGINISLVKNWTPTFDLSDPQEKEKNTVLKIQAPDRTVLSNQRLKKLHDDYYAKMHWTHGPNCACVKLGTDQTDSKEKLEVFRKDYCQKMGWLHDEHCACNSLI